MNNAKYTILSDIEPKPTHWLWKDRIPLGDLTLFDADSATNKSSITLDLAARVSVGGDMPDGTEGLLGGVVLLQTEDSLEKTVVPRLDAAGADRSHIAILPDAITIPDALADVEATIIELQAKLLVIDPLSEFMARSANSEQSVRQALAPLAALAERQKVAVILVRHLNKSVGQRAMYRGLGSIGIVAAARSRFVLGPNPKDPNLRVMVHTKSNLGLLTDSLLYEPVTGENGAVRIEWRGECDYRAEDILAPPKGGHREREDAKRFLITTLAAGPVAQKDIQAEAAKWELAWRTVERAKADLGIASERRGFGQGSAIYWSLPSEEGHTPPTDQMAVNDADEEQHSPPAADVAVNDGEAHTPPCHWLAVYGEKDQSAVEGQQAAERDTATATVLDKGAAPKEIATDPNGGKLTEEVAETDVSGQAAEAKSDDGNITPDYASDGECSDHNAVLDGDGACASCGRFDPSPPTKPKSPKTSKPKPAKGKKNRNAQKASEEQKDDLAAMVCAVLGRNPSGLKLDQITAKVLNAGYKTKDENLAQAVYNELAALRKEGFVDRDNASKKYALTITLPL